MKTIRNRILAAVAVLLALMLLPWGQPSEARASQSSVIVSVEKGTIGQGYLVEPTRVEIRQGETVEDVTLRLLREKQRNYKASGTGEEFYLRAISDPGRGPIDVPAYIQEMAKKKNLKIGTTDKSPDMLGEFDYCSASGWLYSVNNVFPERSAGAEEVSDGQVIRWQFTLLANKTNDVSGDPSIATDNRIDRVSLYRTLAQVSAREDLMAREEVAGAYRSCVELAGKLTATQTELTPFLAVLNKALRVERITAVAFNSGDEKKASQIVDWGTGEEELSFPKTLTGTKESGGKLTITGVTWACGEGYDPETPGVYLFSPKFQLVASQYALADGTELPQIRVVVFSKKDDQQDGELPMLFQLNNGRAREASYTGETVTENGLTMQEVSVSFETADASDTAENRIRMTVRGSENAEFEIGDAPVGDRIQNPFAEKNGIYYAEGKNGCFTGGRSPQRESCVLYARYTDSSGKTLRYKISVERKGYAAVQYRHSDSDPLILSQWSKNSPKTVSASWNVSDMEIRQWDQNGNPVEGISVAVPGTDPAQGFYLTSGDGGKTGTLSVVLEKSGKDWTDRVNRWMKIVGASGGELGKIRVTAQYPYEAAEYYLKLASGVSLNAADYTGSTGGSLKKYVSAVNAMKDFQKQFPSNVPVYVDQNGRYTAANTGKPLKDSYGWQITSDYLRTRLVLELSDAVDTLKPVLINGKKKTITAALTQTSFTYDGRAKKPGVVVKDSSGRTVSAGNYSVSYSANVNAGTGRAVVTAKGDYKGSAALSFTIRKASQRITVRTASVKTQTANRPFSLGASASGRGRLTYRSSSSAARVSSSGVVTPAKKGTAYITVAAAANANYQAAPSVRVKIIVLQSPSLKVSRSSVKKTWGSRSFSLGVKASKGASVSCKSSNKKVATVTKSGKVTLKGTGKATITVTASLKKQGKNVKKVTITVKPVRPSLSSLKSKKKGQLTAYWMRDRKASGYQVSVSTDKRFRKNVKTITIKSSKSVSKTFKSLSRGKKYYVRVRSFGKSGGTVYSSWSRVKTVKVRKR